jgi:Restriction endonuclease
LEEYVMRHLSFGRLSAVEFEEFCFDLLHALRFINIDWRKGTPLKSSPADSGRDIVAYEERVDVDGSKHHEKWFVDCRHHKKGVPPNELRSLLTWAEAERPDVALFVISGSLSNPAKGYETSFEPYTLPAKKLGSMLFVDFARRHCVERVYPRTSPDSGSATRSKP